MLATDGCLKSRLKGFVSKVKQPIISTAAGDPEPGQHQAALTITLEAIDAHGGHVTAFYTEDGTVPDEGSPSFHGERRFQLTDPGNHVMTCYAKDQNGAEHYAAFPYTVGG